MKTRTPVQALDPHIYKMVQKDIEDLKNYDIDVEEYLDFETYFSAVVEHHEKSASWEAQAIKLYYAAAYTRYMLELQEREEKALWVEKEDGRPSNGDELMTNGWED